LSKIIKNKHKGILFWVTGLSGSGKTTIAKQLRLSISKYYGPTIVISGDDLRKNFDLKKYDRESRLSYGKKYTKLCKLITNQKINIIFAVVGLFDELRSWNKKNIHNYCEIFIKSPIKKIIKTKKKKVYFSGSKEIVGLNIKPEFPKKPNIVIKNNFKKSTNQLSKILIKKIQNIV